MKQYALSMCCGYSLGSQMAVLVGGLSGNNPGLPKACTCCNDGTRMNTFASIHKDKELFSHVTAMFLYQIQQK